MEIYEFLIATVMGDDWDKLLEETNACHIPMFSSRQAFLKKVYI